MAPQPYVEFAGRFIVDGTRPIAYHSIAIIGMNLSLPRVTTTLLRVVALYMKTTAD